MKTVLILQDTVVAGVPALKRGAVRRVNDELANSLISRGLAQDEEIAKKSKELEAEKETPDAPASVIQKGGKKSNNL